MRIDKNVLTPEDLLILVQIASELTAQINLKTMLQHILDKACSLTNSPDCSVILHNENRNTLYFAAVEGDNSEALLEKWGEFSEQQIPIHGSKAGKVFVSGKSEVYHELENDLTHYKEVDRDLKSSTQRMVCVPLIVSGHTIGVMQVLNKRENNYDKRDIALMEHFSSLAAVAIRNARLFQAIQAYMGYYTSGQTDKDLTEIMVELKKPAWLEKLTIIIPDMRGFTQLVQFADSPETAQKRLNEFLTMLTEEVLKHGGVVNKFLGDGVMAIFRDSNYTIRAVKCAFSMVDRFNELKKIWNEGSNIDLDFLDIGIGITTDAVMLGTIGTHTVRDFTVIGNAVNLASAFENAARDGKRILVDNITFQAVKDIIGKFEGPEIFELRKPGQKVGHPFKQYHLSNLKQPVHTTVFISHSIEDRDFVEKELTAVLPEHSINTWYAPDDIPKGENWVRSIREGLSRSQWMIVVVSKDSAKSPWVRKEIDLALADSRFEGKIIPINIDNTDPQKVNEWLISMQAINAYGEESVARVICNRILEMQ